jgi:hypothetical protein
MVCGHVFNATFDERLVDYDEHYEVSQMFSPRFRKFAQNLADRLVEAYDLRGADIVEIGGGKGDFLERLCAGGNSRGVSIDPSYDGPTRGVGVSGRVSSVQDVYGEVHADLPADYIVCRHTLEHIWDAPGFLSTVRRSIGSRTTPVYFEVPNAAYMLRRKLISDITYQHCSYFTPSSLLQLFADCGFSVQYIIEAFEGQFLSIAAVPTERVREPPQMTTGYGDLPGVVAEFREAFETKTRRWEEVLASIERRGSRAVVWGAGAKAVTFLNALPRCDAIPYVVDVSPRKAGRYIAGTGQRIVSPEFLRRYVPDVILIVNPIYHAEIREAALSVGVDAEYVLV